MYFTLFIPTTLVGWKYCFKNPSSFFKSWSHHSKVEKVSTNLLRTAEYMERVVSKSAALNNKLLDENDKLKRRLKE